MEGVGEKNAEMDRISERKNEWADRGSVPPAEEKEKKKAMLLNQIFSFCSVCRHNGCFSLEKLTGWHFLLWDGPVQIRGNWFNGSALMAQKATSSVSTFLLSLFFPFFFVFCLPSLFSFPPQQRLWRMPVCLWASVDAFAGDSLADGSLGSIAAVFKPAHTASGPTGCSVNPSWYKHTNKQNRRAFASLVRDAELGPNFWAQEKKKKKSVMLEQF